LCSISGTMNRHLRVHFGRCAINTVAGRTNFPFGEILAPFGDTVPFWGYFERLYWSYGLQTCLNLGQSETNTMAGIRKSHFGGILPLLTSLNSPLNLWKTCGVIRLMDPYPCAKFHPSGTNAVVAIHFCHLRTNLRTTLAVTIMRSAKLCFVTRIKN